MAEAYPVPPSKLVDSSIDALTECPICLDQFQHPKALPCLHTFCKICLHTFIQEYAFGTKSTSMIFPCPICRKDTQPADTSVSHTKWAEQFPTNSLVVAILDMKKLKLSNRTCVPCTKKNNHEKEAILWCKNCSMFLCGECREVHDIFIVGHDILTAEEVEIDPTKTITVSTKCEEHDEIMKLFCGDHKVVCCSTCVAVGHRKCDNVITVKEQAKLLNESNDVPILTNIGNDIITLDVVLKGSEENLKELSQSQKRQSDEMVDLRKQIDTHLDYLQKIDMTKSVMDLKKQQNDIKSRMTPVRNLKSAIEQSQKQIRAAEICMDDAELVLTLQKVSSTRDGYQETIEEIVSRNKRYKLGYEMNEALKSILDTLVFSVTKAKLEFVRNVDPFVWCNKAKQTNTLKMKQNSRTTGAVFFDADTIVSVDNKNNLLCCNFTDGSLKFLLRLDGKPWDLCKINHDSVAVTIPGKETIAIVEVGDDNFCLKWNILVSGKCHGIACIGDRFLVTCPRENEILIVDTSGSNQKSITLKKKKKNMWHAVAPKGSNAFVISDRIGMKGETMLHKLDEEDIPSCFFQSDLISGGRGMDADEFSNIYVCAIDDNSILMVSPKGESKIFLSGNDGLSQPCSVAVCGDRVVIFEEKSATGKMFQILP
ncbi:E3 ubiquitin-protein ligase Midline-1-like [Ylistrum balloti]|uniref:E3 ubiquitin-protein ligase Midline-1-like n=1 Tax=Ylistrum balloti TaxID=509963 RepID=UPI002905DFED|nr:E3 ubiquitin-protein ligase Midline-1-like [Ylistrum balloti]